ncbi:urea transporter [Escherichia coli]
MGHPEILYFSAISAALSPFFAWCLRYPDEEINEGIWGYNAVLYGIACGMVVPVSPCQSPVLLYLSSEVLVLFCLLPCCRQCSEGYPY